MEVRYPTNYPVSAQLVEHENELINALDTAHSSTGQKVKKAGALTLALLGASVAFVLQGIWSVGGLRKPWFDDLGDYKIVGRIWHSMPLSDESAQKVATAAQAVKNDLERIFKNTPVLSDIDPGFNDPRYQAFETLQRTWTIDANHLKTLTENPSIHLSQAVKELKKAHQTIPTSEN